MDIVSAVISFIVATWMVLNSKSASRNLDFVICFVIAASFFYSQIHPYFNFSMQLFSLVFTVVVFVGGCIGGVIGILLPKISMGISMGYLLATFFGLLLYSYDIGILGQFIDLLIFIVFIGFGLYAAQKSEDLCSISRISLATGFVYALSIDYLLKGGMIAIVVKVLTSSMQENTTICFNECHVEASMLTWVLGTIFAFFMNPKSFDAIKRIRNGNFIYIYKSLNSIEKMADSKTVPMKQKTFSYPDALEFNYFDPDNLPDIVNSYADIVFSTVQTLAKMYGYQVDNSRNQAEHLLMLLANEQDSNDQYLQSPVERLHRKLFHNYKKWCDFIGCSPNFVKITQGKIFHGLIEDMLMWLLIWGEAANLKHMPECITYLYHKQMEEHIKNISNVSVKFSIHAYPGYFLDMVITPIYDIVATASKSKGEHDTKMTYDDFNEFFWTPKCLRFSLSDYSKEDLEDADVSANYLSSNSTDNQRIHVATALQHASKTYVEKRSWLHPLLTLRRLMEWEIITFTLLTTWAYSDNLVWTYSFTLQVGSFIFWEITFLSIVWTCLEVWSLYPHAKITAPSVLGYLIRLLAGYLVLVYQTIYYHWSYRIDEASHGSMRSHGDPVFWWWQYVWLSLLANLLYITQCFMCFFPKIASNILTFKNDALQAILNICYPSSQLYVGKKVHVPQPETNAYIFYWLTLIAFKLWFGFRFIVKPVTVPSLELYDDYMNTQRVSFIKTCLLMFVWWFPHFLVYLIDMSIWYSMWSSLVGGFIALVERQGAVRDMRTLKSHFMRSPLAFCQKVLPFTYSGTLRINRLDTNSVSQSDVGHMPDAAKAIPKDIRQEPKKKVNVIRAKSSADLMSYQSNIQTPSEEVVDLTDGPVSSTMAKYLDVRSKRWVIFGRIWNEVIVKMRETDIISNSEKDLLLFTTFDWLGKPVYLPLFQTVGCVETAMYYWKDAQTEYFSEKDNQKKMEIIEKCYESFDVTTKEAINEAWELLTWLLKLLLGPVHSVDVFQITNDLENIIYSANVIHKINANEFSNILNTAGNIVFHLNKCIGNRKKNPIVTPAVIKQTETKKIQFDEAPTIAPKAGMKKSVSTGFLSALHNDSSEKIKEGNHDHAVSSRSQFSKFTKLQPFRQAAVLVDNNRDKVREELRSLFNQLKNSLRGDAGSKDTIDRITFISSMESGFMWNDLYASMQLDETARDLRVPSILQKLNGLLRMRQTQVELSSPEAQRRLNFFVNSLFMDMPAAPMTRFCKDYTCITPFYSEDVLLTKEDLESKNSDGISTILYLQTLYKKDWQNFLERLGTSDEEQVWSHKHILETRIWASLRAQTLYRTVTGMMYTEAALRLIAHLEEIPDKEIENIVKVKFTYVLACQVYGQMKKNLEHKAEDIEFLLAKHPHLRVAYIDSVRVNREGEMAYYSVLIKHDPIKSSVKEVYRIKLPGNPVLGEGKPENQNHAIVFTRGRYIQAIDMNQDGYFEDSLKMRNMLQEFDSGCSIVGFREHIFTGSVSSVANYMALQELSFVTLGQRVLANPLRIRQHYGHPDFFDKMFVMTEGGMSKASKGINLSEDVFAGFNATIRGHTVSFKEYAQVGKGRDVGLQQTYKFEAKLSQGNAEQSLSRDLYRICDRLDFFRLCSFFWGGIGHYISNAMVMFTLVLVVYTMLALAIYGEEGVNGRPMHPEGVLQLLLSGLGLLQTLPLFITLTVEKGIISAVSEISFMFLSGGPLYFIFHIQTKSYYFQQTLLAGGAMYRPTGRGFVIRHSPFDENFRFFVSSHIYLGIELMVALILFFVYTTSKQYGGLTWSLWLTVASFLMGPFWFNPVTFEINKVKEDYILWMNWMTETGGTGEQSWECWWKEENSFYGGLSLSWKIFLFVQKSCIWLFISYGLAGSRLRRDSGEQLRVLQLFLLFGVFVFGHWCIAKVEKSLVYAIRRFCTLCLSTVVSVTTIYLFISHPLYIKFSIAIYYLFSAVSFFLLLCGFKQIQWAYKFHDYAVGHVLMFILLILSGLQIAYLQTWLLYHNALSAGVY